MGLGGYLTWTALAREIAVRHGKRCLPIEVHGNAGRVIESPSFDNNPNIVYGGSLNDEGIQLLVLNDPYTNYCKQDTPTRAVHRYDKHIIEQLCEHYGIEDPELRCDMYLADEEMNVASRLVSDDRFIVIEPSSKVNYTPNRVYPFEKWQRIVDAVSKEITIVQVGKSSTDRVLKGVRDLTGQTSFREACAVIRNARCLLASEGGLTHAATAMYTPAVVVITGYQSPTMVAYPQNVNINIARHGPCGMKQLCPDCVADRIAHDETEIIDETLALLSRES